MKPKEKRRLLYHSLHACLPIMEGDRQLIVNDIADKVWIEIERWEVKNNVDLANVRQQSELVFCEGVIHHTCRHFNQIVGCDHCMIKEYKAK